MQTMAIGSVGAAEHIVYGARHVSGSAEEPLGDHAFLDNACGRWRQCWQPVCHQGHPWAGESLLRPHEVVQWAAQYWL